MSAAEDQVRTGAILNAEEAQSRTFAHEPGEGEAWWWLGVLATIKATKKQTGERYSVVEILAPDGYGSAARPSPRGRRLLHPRRRDDFLRGRSDHKGAPWLLSLWSQGCSPRLHG